MPAFSFKKICPWCVQHEAAQRGELDENARQPVITAPWVQRESTVTLTQVIFGANVMVFIAMVIAMVWASGPSLDFSAALRDFPGLLKVHFGANYGPYTLSGDWWRLLTYMFVHADFWHIAFNLWCLRNLGTLCESLYGRWTFAAIYLITGIAGGLASAAWNPEVLSVGASGAIFGLAGALIASFYLGEFNLPSYVIQANLKSLLFFAGFNILFGISPIGDLFGIHVDNACHIGGLISGLALGALIGRVAPQHDSPRRIGILVVVALAVAVTAFGVQRWRGGPMQAARAFDSISNQDPNRGIARLQAIVKQQPNLPQAHFALGQAYFNQEQFLQAESEFKRGLELQPQNADARFNLGITLLNEKRPEEATAAFQQILAQYANSADAHYGLGLALADQEKHEAAIAEFKTATSLHPQIPGIYYEMGESYAKLKMYDEAIAAYGNERDKNGDVPEIELALADAYQAKGMTQQAQDAKNKAAQLKSAQR
jgi:rhomboid protease GluP